MEKSKILRLAVAQIKDFGLWTHNKPENEVLSKQAQFFVDLVKKLESKGGFALTQRGDTVYILANGINKSDFIEIQEETRQDTCYFRFAVVEGINPLDLEKKANLLLKRHPDEDIIYNIKDKPNDYITILSHYDIRGFENLKLSSYELEEVMIKCLADLRKIGKEYGILAWYTSGDNILAITNGLTLEQQEEIYEKLTGKMLINQPLVGGPYKLRVGIGVHKSANLAANFSAIALDNLRILEKNKHFNISKHVICFGNLHDLKKIGYHK